MKRARRRLRKSRLARYAAICLRVGFRRLDNGDLLFQSAPGLADERCYLDLDDEPETDNDLSDYELEPELDPRYCDRPSARNHWGRWR